MAGNPPRIVKYTNLDHIHSMTPPRLAMVVQDPGIGRPRYSWRSGTFRSPQTVNPDGALLRRRRVYRNKLYSLHVGSNRLSRFQHLSPAIFNHDPELMSRARKWIRRELQVFEYLSSEGNEVEAVARRVKNAEFVLEYIVAILKTVNLKGSDGQAEDMLGDFFGRDNAQLFIHELCAWLRSPYTSLDDWDRHVQYGEATGTTKRGESQKRRSIVVPDANM
ncbi:hypothetical protein ACLMJK_000241 [Lecanora helva]